jgi:hypothetical protein
MQPTRYFDVVTFAVVQLLSQKEVSVMQAVMCFQANSRTCVVRMAAAAW